jgi:hypothetical protein
MLFIPARFATMKFLIYILLVPILFSLGCGVSKRKTTTITGKITADGKPVTVGAIYFHGANNQIAMGTIGKDGTFTVTDVPLGEVRVSLQVRDPGVYTQDLKRGPQIAADGTTPTPPGVTSVLPKYADPDSSGLKYSITESTKNIEVKIEEGK